MGISRASGEFLFDSAQRVSARTLTIGGQHLGVEP